MSGFVPPIQHEPCHAKRRQIIHKNYFDILILDIHKLYYKYIKLTFYKNKIHTLKCRLATHNIGFNITSNKSGILLGNKSQFGDN